MPLALVPQLLLAGVLVPKLPALAEAMAKVAVSGYWLTEAMKSVFISSDGPIRVLSASTGRLVEITAEPAGLGAVISLALVPFTPAGVPVLAAAAAALVGLGAAPEETPVAEESRR